MKSFWLGAAVRDRVGRGRSETQMLITAHPVSVAGKTKSIFYELRGSNTTCSRCHSLRSLWHFFCWLPSLFHRFLLHAAARKFFLHHFGSPWKKSQWPTEIAGHVFWPCGSGFDGSVGQGACCGCVPRPAIAVRSAVHFIIILRAIKMKCQTKWQQFWLNFFVYDSVDKK